MNIIYGSEPPKISFKTSPKGGISFQIENHNYFEVDDANEDISWVDLYRRKFPLMADKGVPRRLQEPESAMNYIKLKFNDVEMTESEQKFFNFYLDFCNFNLDIPWNSYESFMLYPALIPQVWVNWIHYDNKDAKRAERMQREPFRIDFLIKGKYIKDSPLIIEIDGASHFGAYADDPRKAMLIYTEHLRKDRWLRKQGWNVVRISNYEVECCQTLSDFFTLFYELTGWS